jgi:hypothetical protein
MQRNVVLAYNQKEATNREWENGAEYKENAGEYSTKNAEYENASACIRMQHNAEYSRTRKSAVESCTFAELSVYK